MNIIYYKQVIFDEECMLLTIVSDKSDFVGSKCASFLHRKDHIVDIDFYSSTREELKNLIKLSAEDVKTVQDNTIKYIFDGIKNYNNSRLIELLS